MSLGAYFWRGGGVQREVCVSKSVGLACSGEEIYHLCFVFTLYSRANSKYKPPGCTYIWRGDLTEGLLRYDLGGGGLIIIWRGLNMEGLDYFRNFMVCYKVTWLCKPLIASLFYYERYFLMNRTLASCFKPQS